MDKTEILQKLDCAINEFSKRHKDLLEIEVNERSMTHKFAECLTPLFEGWDVDCEYNRDGYNQKLIGINIEETSSDDIEMRTIYPDIIIHHRTKSGLENNLLVIEAKKNASVLQEKNDIEKLVRIVTQLEYQMGVFLNIDSVKSKLEKVKIIPGKLLAH